MPVGELNAFGITKYDNYTSFFGGHPVMSRARPSSFLHASVLSHPFSMSSLDLSHAGPLWAILVASTCICPAAVTLAHTHAATLLLAEAYGYGIVVGFGIFFSLFTSLIVFLDYRSACY